MTDAERLLAKALAMSRIDRPRQPAKPSLAWLRIHQMQRQRLRYLRNVDPLTIQMVTAQELMELSPRRSRRIRAAGDWLTDCSADALRRPTQGDIA